MTTAEAEVLPWLPDTWLDGIKAGEYRERSRAKAGAKRQREWAKARPDSEGDPCAMMQRALDEGIEEIKEGSAHDRTNSRVYQLCSLGFEGHRGLWRSMMKLRTAFIDEVSGKRKSDSRAGKATGTVRGKDEADSEFRRIWTGAVDLMLGHAKDSPDDTSDGAAACSCWDEPEGEFGDNSRAPHQYECSDDGTAEQIRDVAGHRLAWVDGPEWVCFSPETGLWSGQGEEPADEEIRSIRRRIHKDYEIQKRASEELAAQGKSEAEMVEGRASALYAWNKKLGDSARFTGIKRQLRTQPGMRRGPSSWDVDPQLLGLGDGRTLVLGRTGVTVRNCLPEDHLTKKTTVPYVEGATHPAWSGYLDRFLPDPELRDWLQRLFGYSLVGGNPERLLVFLHGPTSSGKSTLIEAVGAVMGDYSATFSSTIFRDRSEEGPRAELFRIMRRRFAFAAELGGDKHLHNDAIKRIVGGDRMPIRDLFDKSKDMLDEAAHFTPFIATNSAPHIKGADQALWRRLYAVPFDKQVFGEDDDAYARDRLKVDPDAQAAVLAWLVSGWQAYCERGVQSDVPAAVVNRTMEFREDMSQFHQWMYSRCSFEPDAISLVSDLFQNYANWCAENSIDKPDYTQQTFGNALTDSGFPKEKSRSGPNKNKVLRHGIRIAASGIKDGVVR